MELKEIKRLIESRYDHDDVKRLLAMRVQRRSPQTDMLEEEPEVLSLIREVIRPELEQSNFKPQGLFEVTLSTSTLRS
jgi:hypothetical protein